MSTLYNKSWLSGETVTPDKLNKAQSDVMRRLNNKNLAVCKVNTVLGENQLYLGGNNNTFFKFTRPMRVGLTIEQGSALKIGVSGTIRLLRTTTNVAVQTHAHLDILIDDSMYLSSLTASPTSDGIYKNRTTVNSIGYVQNRASWIITQLNEGFHSFELVGKAPDIGLDNFTLYLQPNFFFWAEEYGVNIGQLIGANNT